MISRYQYHGLTWVDLENPTREEILHILEEFSLPQVLSDEVYESTLRSKVDLYDNFMYLILHFPMTKGADEIVDQEIDFILGKNFVITAHYEKIEPLYEFARAFEVNSKLDRDSLSRHSGFIFNEMMKQLYQTSLKELEDITDEIAGIEKRIFSGQEEMMVRKISIISRKLLDFKQTIRFHGDILKSYENASMHFFGMQYGYYAAIILSEYNKVSSILESNKEVLIELQRTNDSLLSTKTNDIMRTFTIMTFIMVPLSLITGIFGMNTSAELLFIKTRSDFFFVIGTMLLIAMVMALFFKIRKWL